MPRTLLYLFSMIVLMMNAGAPTGLAVLASNSVQGPVFKENKGQVHDQFEAPRPDVLFSGQHQGMNFFLRRDGISYQWHRVERWEKQDIPDHASGKLSETVPGSIRFYRVDIRWIGANPQVGIEKPIPMAGYENYYNAASPHGALQVKSYAQLLYRQLYPGIDLKWYGKGAALKYDFIVAAGADYQQIRFDINGAENLYVNKHGALILETPLGTLTEQAPLVLQDGRRLEARWQIHGHCVSFLIAGIDPNKPFVIDPLVRLWGTYYGGSLEDNGESSACDAAGNVYLCGQTKSLNNIATSGAQQGVYGGVGNFWGDAFLVKFDPLGNRLWATYYGGPGNDYAAFCFPDAAGNVYLTGSTNCTISAVIATPGAHQTTSSGGIGPGSSSVAYDAFLVKFDATGTRLWGTFYGGEGWEWAWPGGAADNNGNVYLSGSTNSTGNIATPGSQQATLAGNADAFLVQFNSQGVRQWATYFGGTGNEYWPNCAVDAAGNVYICGVSASAAGVATPGAHQTVYGGGQWDTFVAKYNATGQRQWSSYYGGNSDDYGYSIAVYNNALYIGGSTASNNTGNAIATPGAHQPANAGVAGVDSYLASFDLNGNRQWGTFYGGIGTETWGYLAMAPNGDVFLSGSTTSFSGIATPCTYKDSHDGGTTYDSYLVRFTPGGQRIWGTYYGGPGNEEWTYCSTDASGNVYISGKTNSSSGISSPGGFQTVYTPGPSEAYLIKFDGCINAPPPNTTPPLNLLVCEGSTTWLYTDPPCITWFNTPTGGTAVGNGSTYQTPPVFSNTTFYLEEAACGSVTPRTAVEVTVLPVPLVTANSDPSLICAGQSTSLSASGALTYSWSSTFSANEGTGSGISSNPSATAVYTVAGDNGTCLGYATVTVEVVSTPSPVIAAPATTVCTGAGLMLNASGAGTYSWQPANTLSQNTGPVVTANPTGNTTYTLTGSNSSGTLACTMQTIISISVVSYVNAYISSNVTICEGEAALLLAGGGSTYSWSPPDGLMETDASAVLASPTVTTVYSVTVSNANLCGTAKTVIVVVNPKPTLSAGRDTSFNLKEPMYITASGTGKINWIAGEDIGCPDCPATQIFPIRKTCYTAMAVSDRGCTATDEVCIDVGSEFAVYIPNTFTPNGDHLNEVFTVSGFGISDIKLTIYDRWGEKLFTSSHEQEGWNGSYRGRPCQAGNYSWVVEYVSSNGRHQQQTGYVILLR